jgi:hypothetical protein
MVVTVQHSDDVLAGGRPQRGGLAMLAPAIGPGWVGEMLGGLPLMAALAAAGALLGLACGRHLTRLLQAEAALVGLMVLALLVV